MLKECNVFLGVWLKLFFVEVHQSHYENHKGFHQQVSNGKSYNKGIVVKEMYFPCIREGAQLLLFPFITLITMTTMMTTTTDPMMRLSFIFCHHILRLTLRDVTRNSSARLESISDLPSRLSNLCPLSRILLMFSVIILETSATCCCNF